MKRKNLLGSLRRTLPFSPEGRKRIRERERRSLRES
jgi:hypothetical protein